MNDNPMHARFLTPRCTATSKRTGKSCKAPAVRGWTVCRMHGARGGAPEGIRNGNFTHGLRTKAEATVFQEVNGLVRQATSTIKEVADV